MAGDESEKNGSVEVGEEEDNVLGVEGDQDSVGKDNIPAGKKDAIEMAPVRLSLPSKVMGVSWFVLFYMFLESDRASACAIGTIIVGWAIWELHWRRLWARQRDEAAALFEKLRQAQLEGGGGEGAPSQVEVVRQLQQVALQVATSTTQTPLRCFVESLLVLAGGAPPPCPPTLPWTAATEALGAVWAFLQRRSYRGGGWL